MEIAGQTILRLFLVLAAAAVLWWLGHVLLHSVWTLARISPASSLPRVADVVLAPLVLAAAWWALARIGARA